MEAAAHFWIREQVAEIVRMKDRHGGRDWSLQKPVRSPLDLESPKRFRRDLFPFSSAETKRYGPS